MLDDRKRVSRLKKAPREDVSMGKRMNRFVEALQTRICKALEDTDGRSVFKTDRWIREEGGGGITRVLEDGAVFEKAGVNTSAVFGQLPERMATALNVTAAPFFATGLSLVVHPRSPYVPTVHFNIRYFAMGEDPMAPVDQWFGGGADLTPYYPFKEDAHHFHSIWKDVCDRHVPGSYREYKSACDQYFYLAHRGETRGVGGIFFDYLREDPEETFLFVRNAGRALLSSYLPIVERRRGMTFGKREIEYHEIRRGRYVEFNLIFDRGTKFGIETGGRAESILMSLPPRARWKYDWQPEPGSKEAAAAAFFKPQEWL